MLNADVNPIQRDPAGPVKAAAGAPYRETERALDAPRMQYLWPSRYFHFYVLYDRKARQTCWLPEGYGQ